MDTEGDLFGLNYRKSNDLEAEGLFDIYPVHPPDSSINLKEYDKLRFNYISQTPEHIMPKPPVQISFDS